MHVSDISVERARLSFGATPSPGQRTILTLALVILAHGAVFWSIAYRIPFITSKSVAADDDRAIEIDLSRRFVSPQTPPQATAPKLGERRPASPAPVQPPVMTPHFSTAPSAPPSPFVPEGQTSPNKSQDEAARRAIRGLVGCADPDAYTLTQDERSQCFRNARQAVQLPHTLDPKEQAAFDADGKRGPWLVRTPHNNCEPRVADQPIPAGAAVGGRGGASMAARIKSGVDCSVSF